MVKNKITAVELHNGVPPDWYHRSIRENRLQRYWHTRRFREVEKLIEPAKSILDIGSADGVFTNVIAKKANAKRVVGIDVLKSSVDWANKHWKNKNIRFQVGDAHNLAFKANEFDAVFALEVLEHVFDPEKVIKGVHRVLKRDGYAIFLVPSENLLFKIVWFLWHFYGRMVWKNTHVQSFQNNSLDKMAAKVGLKIEVGRNFLLGMLRIVKVRKV